MDSPLTVCFLRTQVSNVMSQIIVQKLNGMHVLSPLLKSDRVNVQRAAVALIGNLNRNPNLHNSIGERKKTKKKPNRTKNLSGAFEAWEISTVGAERK